MPPVRPQQQRAAGVVVLAANMLLFSSCKRRKAFAFHKLSDHINSDSCNDVSALIGKYLVLLTTSVARNKCMSLTYFFVLRTGFFSIRLKPTKGIIGVSSPKLQEQLPSSTLVSMFDFSDKDFCHPLYTMEVNGLWFMCSQHLKITFSVFPWNYFLQKLVSIKYAHILWNIQCNRHCSWKELLLLHFCENHKRLFKLPLYWGGGKYLKSWPNPAKTICRARCH